MQVAKGAGSARQLFGASLSPWWEQKSAYLVPVFALAVAVGGLLLLRVQVRDGRLPRGRRRGLLVGFALLGLVYFPSTIFILAPSGAEGARRSWAFTWIGLCMLAGPAVVWVLDWARRRARQWLRVSLYSGLLAVLAVALVGGTAAGVDASYRFPGPFLYGSDARSVTPELLAASKWFSTTFGTGNNIVTDRYTGLIFGSVGLQDPASPSIGFPVYNLYVAKPGAPIEPAFLLFDLATSNYAYLIVDGRMAYDMPETGMYFTPGEPASLDHPQGGKPIFYGRLGKFNTLPWMVKVFQSDNYSIYRLNLPPAKTGYQTKPPKLHGKPLQGKLVVTP
jgi:MFS family permease